MIEDIKIKKVNKCDLKEIAEIFKGEYAKYPYNERWSMKDALNKIKEYSKYCLILVAKANDRIVGFIIANTYKWYDGMRGLISEVIVSKKYQRKGIGKRLMNSVEDYFRKKKVTNVLLYADKNSKAINFYRRLNYKRDKYIPLVKKLK